MKKVLCLVFVLVMALTALASEQIDIGGMSDEELLATKVVVDDEIEIRGIDELEPFYLGTYTGGQSIKAGEYDLTIVFADNGYVEFFKYASEDAFENGERLISDTIFHGTSNYHFSIADGQVIKLKSSYSIRMGIKSTKPSWAP